MNVAELPARVAHATHALMAASHPSMGGGQGPFTAAEVCIYDAPWEALSARHTGAALREAQRRGLAVHIPGGYWIPTGLAYEARSALEDRYLADETRVRDGLTA